MHPLSILQSLVLLTVANTTPLIGLDQVPESLLPLLVCRRALQLTIWDILIGVIVFFVGVCSKSS